MVRRRKRPAYTLLEIILALTIAVLLLTALYGAVGYQLRQAQAGRDATSQTTLSRSVVARIENDVIASLALSDPGRYRNQAIAAQKQQAQQQQGGTTTGQTGQTGQSSGQQSTQSGKTAQSGQTGGGGTPAASAGGGNTSGMTPQAQSADATDDGSGTAPSADPVVLPCGVIGDGGSLTLFVSRVPSELYGTRAA